jgi:thiol-disulfide isomerase/thioredoxin
VKPLHKILITILLLTAAVAGYNLAHMLRPPQATVPEKPALPVPAELLGQPRPEFTLPDLAGQQHNVTEWDGKVLLINFWATWCAPCREEIPAFIKVRQAYRDRGFEIVGIAIDNPEFVVEYVRDLGINYPVLYGSEDAIETGGRYGNRQGTLPYSVFVNAEGRISHIHNSGVLREAELIGIVEELLQASTENESKRSKRP